MSVRQNSGKSREVYVQLKALIIFSLETGKNEKHFLNFINEHVSMTIFRSTGFKNGFEEGRNF